MTGCEGYVESIATGLYAALAVVSALGGTRLSPPPGDTLLGSLLAYLRDTSVERLTPMNVNFGLLPALREAPSAKAHRREAYTRRAVDSLRGWIADHPRLFADAAADGAA
jgi:methylenetetrahydrofolate--tRNA-(uracil-5-)-methyltransferase